MLRSLLWRRSGDIGKSTDTAASVGRAFGYLMIVLGGLEFLEGAPEGLWLAPIGFFIVMAAGAQAVGAARGGEDRAIVMYQQPPARFSTPTTRKKAPHP